MIEQGGPLADVLETAYNLGEKMLHGKWKEDMSDDVEVLVANVLKYKKYLIEKTSAALIYQTWEDFSKINTAKGYNAAANLVDKSRKKLVIALNDVVSAIIETMKGTDADRKYTY